jgi:hypothetical protein
MAENNQTKKKAGPLTVPKFLDCANANGLLFDPGATAVFNNNGEAKVDTPDGPRTQPDKVDIDDQANKLDPFDPFGKRYDWSKSTLGDAFTLWGGLVKNDAQNNPTQFVPVFQNTWSVNADSSQANRKQRRRLPKGCSQPKCRTPSHPQASRRRRTPTSSGLMSHNHNKTPYEKLSYYPFSLFCPSPCCLPTRLNSSLLWIKPVATLRLRGG